MIVLSGNMLQGYFLCMNFLSCQDINFLIKQGQTVNLADDLKLFLLF